MFERFLTAVLLEMTLALQAHKNFFELSEAQRSDLLKSVKLPTSIRQYLARAQSSEVFTDIRKLTAWIGGADLVSLDAHASGLFRALSDFFTTSFASKLDQLASNFAVLPESARRARAAEVIESDNRLAEALRHVVVTHSYQELAAQIEALAKAVYNADKVLVQIPRDIDGSLKQAMREQLLKDHPHSFPIFQINRGLIGGFRIFVNGTSIDRSWFNRIVKITSYV